MLNGFRALQKYITPKVKRTITKTKIKEKVRLDKKKIADKDIHNEWRIVKIISRISYLFLGVSLMYSYIRIRYINVM